MHHRWRTLAALAATLALASSSDEEALAEEKHNVREGKGILDDVANGLNSIFR